MATNGSTAAHEQTKGSTEAYSSNAAAQETNQSSAATNPSKDEVGWYFVEQYYTTMSKSPEKLHVRLPASASPLNHTSSHSKRMC